MITLDNIPTKNKSSTVGIGNKNTVIVTNWIDSVNRESLYKRRGGTYNRFPHFLISKKGYIFQLLDLKQSSGILKNVLPDVIIIGIENNGYLSKINDTYINKYGQKIPKHYNITEFDWRTQKFWDNYTSSQEEKLAFLINYLSITAKIPPKLQQTNIYIKDTIKNGFFYITNISKEYLDMNPNWNYKKVTKLVDEYREKNNIPNKRT